MIRSVRGLLATALLVGASACVYLPPPGALVVAAAFGPPRPRVEVIGVAPGPGHVWIGGFWRWDRVAYAWVPGRWALRPHPRAVWVPGRWRHHSRGWYWIEGRWR